MSIQKQHIITFLLLILIIPTHTLVCTFTLTGNKQVNISVGSFDAQFTSTSTSSYGEINYSQFWTPDSSTQIASVNFKCSVNSIDCTSSGAQTLRCSNISTAGLYTIQCSGMNTPKYSGIAQGSFNIRLYDGSGNIIDGCLSQTISGFLPGELIIKSSSVNKIDGSNPGISEDCRPLINFSNSSVLTKDADFILMTFSGFVISTLTFQISPYGICSLQSQTSNQVIFKIQNSDQEKGKNLLIEITGGIKTSPSSKANTISLITYRTSNNQIIDQLTAPVSYTPPTGSLTIGTISASPKMVNIQGQYSIPITIQHPLTISGKIDIKVPDTLTYTDMTCSSIINSNEKSGSCSLSSGIITISNSFASAPSSSTVINVKLNFLNPLLSNSNANFQSITTYYDSGSDKVDQFSGTSTVTGFVPATLNTVTPTVGSYLVGQITYIQFQFTTINIIPINAYILIDAPTETQLQASTQCQLQSLDVSCSFSISGTQGKLSSIFTSQINAGVSVTLQIKSGIRTPYSLKPVTSNTFNIQIFDENNVALDRKIGFGSLVMTQQSDITINVQRGSKQNGALTAYTISLTFQTVQEINSLLFIKLSSFSFGVVSATFNGVSVTPVILSDVIQIAIPSKINGGLSASVILNNIYNPSSFQQSQGISAYTKTPDNLYSISTSSSSISVTNNLENSITVDSMQQEYGILGELDIYKFQITVSNKLQSNNNNMIKVQVPTQITMSITDCLSNVINIFGLTITSCTVSSNLITMVIGTVSSSTYSFSFQNLLTNPNSQQTIPIYFQISTFQSTYAMDITTLNNPLLQFKTACTFPCRTCTSSTYPSQCLTCYKSPISTNSYLNSNTCISQCPDAYYNDNYVCKQCSTHCLTCNINGCTKCENKYEIKDRECKLICLSTQYDLQGLCTDCDSTCQTCVTTSTTCTSCVSSKLLYSSKCVTQCPPLLFQVGLTCVACTSPCKECSTSPTTCSSCVNTYYLKGTNCIQNCGEGYFSSVDKCVQCTYPCFNCVDSLTCKDCSQAQGTKYFYNGQCVSTCPNLYYAQVNICLACNTTCANCSNATDCLSCPTNKYLLGTKCIDACPTQYYSTNFVCHSCDTSCPVCSNAIICTACPENTFHLTGKCLTACPDKYFNNSGQCTNCLLGCATCINATECETCPENQYFLNKKCVQECPSAYYINDTKTCTACLTGCATCDKNGCLTCSTNYIFYNSTCVTTCPTGYTEKSGKCEVVTSTDQKVIESLQESKYIPVPFTIVSMIFYLSVVVAKIQKSETFIPGSAVGLGGILVFSSWGIIVYLVQNYFQLELIIIESGMAAYVLLNIINIIMIKCIIRHDLQFDTWYSATRINACSFIILSILSILSFSFTRLYFSRYFGFKFLKCKISNIESLLPLHIINLLAILFSCIPACVSSVLLAYYDKERQQLFISSIDAFIVTVLYIIFLIWEAQKDENFFEQTDYLSSVHQSNRIIPEFFQTKNESQIQRKFSFENLSLDNKQHDEEQLQEPSLPKINDLNSSIDEFQDFYNPKKVNHYKSINESEHQFSNNQSMLKERLEKSLNIQQSKESLLSVMSKSDPQLQNQSYFTFTKKLSSSKIDANQSQNYQDENQEVFKQTAIQDPKESQQDQQLLQNKVIVVVIDEDEEDQNDNEIQQIQEQEQKHKADQEKEEQKLKEEQKQQEEEKLQITKNNEQEKEILKIKQEQEQALLLQQEQERQLQQQRELEQQKLLQKQQQEEIEQQQREKIILEQKKNEEEQKQKLEEEERLKQQEQQQQEQEQQDKLQKDNQQKGMQNEEQQQIQEVEEQNKQDQNEVEQEEQNKQEELSQKSQSEKTINKKLQLSQTSQQQQQQQQQLILYSDEEAQDQEWDEQVIQFSDNKIKTQPIQHIGGKQMKIIQSDNVDGDEDWDVPTSGFVSQQKTQLRNEKPVEDPQNPFRKNNNQQVLNQEKTIDSSQQDWNAPPMAFVQPSELFRASNDSDEDSWTANQISPSDFNTMNQRFDIDKNRQMYLTGEEFKKQKQLIHLNQIDSDNDQKYKVNSGQQKFKTQQQSNSKYRSNKKQNQQKIGKLKPKKSHTKEMNNLDF